MSNERTESETLSSETPLTAFWSPEKYKKNENSNLITTGKKPEKTKPEKPKLFNRNFFYGDEFNLSAYLLKLYIIL